MRSPALIGMVFLVFPSPLLPGATVYDTGYVPGGFPSAWALESDFSQNYSGAIQRAQAFILPNDSQITRLNWWGQYFPNNTPPAQDDFALRIFASVTRGGQPAILSLFEFDVGNLGRVDTGGGVYSYSALLSSPVTLTGGTQYWLSIANYTPTDIDDTWGWQLVSSSGWLEERYSDNTSWMPGYNSGTFAFNLEGVVVPEPSSGALLATSAALILLTQRRSRQRPSDRQ